MPETPQDQQAETPSGGSIDVIDKADLKQMFVLIEGILPFEACLYYQVLPLSIEGSYLNLGMVNPNDHAAADYVRRLVSYINCSIVPRQIPSDWHREILSKFLSHSAKSRQQSEPSPSPKPKPDNSFQESPTLVVSAPTELPTEPVKASSPLSSSRSAAPTSSTAPTGVDLKAGPPASAKASRPPQAPTPQASSPQTSPVSQTPSPAVPAASAKAAAVSASAAPTSTAPVKTASPPKPLKETPFKEAPVAPASPIAAQKNLKVTASKPTPASKSIPAPEPLSASSNSPLDLPLPSQYPHQPINTLRQLSPKALTQELLSRVVTEGIGRLYLERQADQGRVLWSKDGVLQSVLESISAMAFQGVINELKLLTRLSLIPVRKTKQVEIERSYQGQRILLRLRIIPGKHGEEATLQVLRGAALKFYQQQQVEKLSRDALGTAHTLQQRLNEIREQARLHLDLETAPIPALPVIVDLLRQMEQQVQELMVIKENTSPKTPDFQNPFGDD